MLPTRQTSGKSSPEVALAVRPAVELEANRPAWRDVLAIYLRTLESDRTRTVYGKAVAEAFAWWEGVASPADLTGPALVAYRAALLEDGRAPSTHAVHLAALRSFLKWAGRRGACPIPPDVLAEELKSPRSVVLRPFAVLNDLEVADVLAAAGNPRDRALLAVALGAGLRVSELVGIDVADVREADDGAGVLHVRRGKRARDRLVPIRSEVLTAIRAYLHSSGRSLTSSGPLFRAHDRGAARRDRPRLSVRAVGYLVRRLTTAAGVKGKAVSPHALRHSYAIRALRVRRDPVAVSRLLGHANVETTMRYVRGHLDLPELLATVPALPLPVEAKG